MRTLFRPVGPRPCSADTRADTSKGKCWNLNTGILITPWMNCFTEVEEVQVLAFAWTVFVRICKEKNIWPVADTPVFFSLDSDPVVKTSRMSVFHPCVFHRCCQFCPSRCAIFFRGCRLFPFSFCHFFYCTCLCHNCLSPLDGDVFTFQCSQGYPLFCCSRSLNSFYSIILAWATPVNFSLGVLFQEVWRRMPSREAVCLQHCLLSGSWIDNTCAIADLVPPCHVQILSIFGEQLWLVYALLWLWLCSFLVHPLMAKRLKRVIPSMTFLTLQLTGNLMINCRIVLRGKFGQTTCTIWGSVAILRNSLFSSAFLII